MFENCSTTRIVGCGIWSLDIWTFDHLINWLLKIWLLVFQVLRCLKKLCEVCLVGKQSRNSFVSTMPMRSSCILKVVHSDECGPFEEHTIGGNKYCFVCWWVWSKVVDLCDQNKRMKYSTSLRDSRCLSKTRVRKRSKFYRDSRSL